MGWNPIGDIEKGLNRTNELLSQAGNRVNMTLTDAGKRSEAIVGQNAADTMAMFRPGGFNNIGNLAYRKFLQGTSLATGGLISNKHINKMSGPTGAERAAKEKADKDINDAKKSAAALATKEVTDRQNQVLTKLEQVYRLRERSPGRQQTMLTGLGSQPGRNTLLTLKSGN